MKEVKKPIREYVVHAMCECGGEFIPGDVVFMTYPVQYSHTCNKCGASATFNKKYPSIEYEEIDISKPVLD